MSAFHVCMLFCQLPLAYFCICKCLAVQHLHLVSIARSTGLSMQQRSCMQAVTGIFPV